MNLPSHQQKAIELLPPNAREVVVARFQTKKIHELKINEAKTAISAMITALYMDTSTVEGSNDAANIYLTEKVYEEMTTKFKHISIGELKICLNEGIRKSYGEYFGINISTINKWLKAYEASEYRKSSINYYNLLVSNGEPKKELTPKEQEEIVRKGCINAYNDFLQDGSMPKYGAVYYKYLKPRLNITWSETESEEIRTIAKQASIGNETNYKTECKNVALKKWFQKIKPNTNYENFKNLLEPFK